MNELTERLIRETANQYKYLAKKNDWNFHAKVHEAYWIHIHAEITRPLQVRFYRIFAALYPECVDDDGLPIAWKLELEISDKLIEMVYRVLDKNPELQLDKFGDLPQRIAEPQIKLF